MLASLRSRLALSNLLITLLGLAAMVAVFSNLLFQRSVDVRKSELARESRGVALQVHRLYQGHGSLGALKSLIDQESQILGERIIIVNPSGHVVEGLDSALRTPYFSELQYPLDLRALSRGNSTSQLLQGRDVVSFQAPIAGTHGHRNGGAVIYVASAPDVSSSLQSILPFVLVAVSAAVLIWILIGVYFAYSISRPLLRMAAATREMGRGNYAARVEAGGHGEIAHVARSFNRMAEQVQRSNQVLKDFLGNVSHDLRTPLTVIAGFSEAVLDGTATAAEAEASAVVIHEEAVKMQRLVDELLQLTRLESGLIPLDRHAVHVRTFVQGCAERVTRARAPGAAAEIVNLISPDLPPVDVDPERMERAVRNLLENALQYTPASGTVTIRAARRPSNWVEVSVADNGAGIAPDALPRVFERFYRSDRSRERGQGHSGLGLAIVREIVEAHGGVVTVESERGGGTTFRFTVPVFRGGGSRLDSPPEREQTASTASP